MGLGKEFRRRGLFISLLELDGIYRITGALPEDTPWNPITFVPKAYATAYDLYLHTVPELLSYVIKTVPSAAYSYYKHGLAPAWQQAKSLDLLTLDYYGGIASSLLSGVTPAFEQVFTYHVLHNDYLGKSLDSLLSIPADSPFIVSLPLIGAASIAAGEYLRIRRREKEMYSISESSSLRLEVTDEKAK